MNKDDNKPAAPAPPLSSAELGFQCAKWGIQLLIDSGRLLSTRSGEQVEAGSALLSAAQETESQ